ncbi:MAG: P22 coat protein - protein 5 domain protein [Candidatus Saccharimonadales bacterium]
MSINNFIPEIWAAQLLQSNERNLVFGALANRDYNGVIAKAGDTVRITSIGAPTVATYIPNVTVIVPEELTDAQMLLTVTESKYFAFKIDNVDRSQALPGVMDEALRQAGYKLRDIADRFVASFYTGVAAANALGVVAVTTPALAFDQLNKLMVKLDEADIPSEGRWVVAPPWYCGLLTLDARVTNLESLGPEALVNGRVLRAQGFDIHKSNNCVNPTGDDWIVMAGTNAAISFVEQIPPDGVVAYKPESSFSDAVKGLHLYGAKLVRPDGIATLQASIT